MKARHCMNMNVTDRNVVVNYVQEDIQVICICSCIDGANPGEKEQDAGADNNGEATTNEMQTPTKAQRR